MKLIETMLVVLPYNIAPITGARIETPCSFHAATSLPIAPITGARIETTSTWTAPSWAIIAPITGARIET